tara:strand:- start:565 stop:810 length:246 start_codon:yes stop_codon:yes gene_type:complete
LGGLFAEKGSYFLDFARRLTNAEPVSLFTMGAVLVDPRCTQTSIVNEFHKHKSQVSEAVSRLLEKRFIEKNDNKLRVVVDI